MATKVPRGYRKWQAKGTKQTEVTRFFLRLRPSIAGTDECRCSQCYKADSLENSRAKEARTMPGQAAAATGCCWGGASVVAGGGAGGGGFWRNVYF